MRSLTGQHSINLCSFQHIQKPRYFFFFHWMCGTVSSSSYFFICFRELECHWIVRWKIQKRETLTIPTKRQEMSVELERAVRFFFSSFEFSHSLLEGHIDNKSKKISNLYRVWYNESLVLVPHTQKKSHKDTFHWFCAEIKSQKE